MERAASGASALALLITMAACASFDPGEEGGEPVTTIGCANNVSADNSLLDWKLEVDVPNPIVSGESFNADLGGTAVFDESFLDAGCGLIGGGCEVVNLVDLKATVHVRRGASGPDVTLTVDEDAYDYECKEGKTVCDPQNDLEGIPGARANTDCQPEGAFNPCGRFVRVPASSDCGPDGPCAERNKTGPQSQCDINGFCITGDLTIQLEAATGRYTADSEGEVLFGWADESTGATIREDGSDAGTWILPEAIYSETTGPLGLRLSVGGFPVALECTMAVDCKGPLSNVDCVNFLSSPTPSFALISIPIEQPP